MARADANPDPQEPTRDIAVADDPPAATSIHDALEANGDDEVRRRVIREHVKILFIAANSRTDPRLALNEEYRTIADKLRGARFRDAFEIVMEPASRQSDLQRALLQHKPDIVHFACHGSEEAELVLLKDDGTSGPIAAKTLAAYFRILRDNIALVVLNACFASKQAAAIRKTIDLTIGIRQRVADTAAIGFSGAFYEALAYGCSVSQAFKLGVAAIGSEQAGVPELFARDGIDAKAICFIGEQPARPLHRRPWWVWGAPLAAACALAGLAWRWLPAVQDMGGGTAHVDAPIADAPVVDASAPVPVPPNMVRFSGARIRPGIFDLSQRPAACAALTPGEDCVRRRDPREVPEVALEDFYLDQYEVTNHDFAAWLNNTSRAWRRNDNDRRVIETSTEPSVFLVRTGDNCGLAFVDGRIRIQADRGNQPATCMTWMAARDYCLSHPDRKRLPLDTEWEFAAKGPEGRAFPWVASQFRPDGVAFGRGTSTEQHPVDVGTSKQDVSPQGIYDLGGNVAEWVEDEHLTGTTQTIRGGSWNSRGPCHLLGSGCKRIEAESFSPDVGFRCAKTVVMGNGRK